MNNLAEPSQHLLEDSFFDRDAQLVARELLGMVIRHCVDGLWLSARIIETEAYYIDEKASHSSLGNSPSRRAMFMPAGHLYLYYSRGGDSLNFSVRGDGNAVCIKAGYPWVDSLSREASLERMRSNSPAAAGGPRALTRLCSGQTLLCKALGLTVKEWNAQRMDHARRALTTSVRARTSCRLPVSASRTGAMSTCPIASSTPVSPNIAPATRYAETNA